jgi:hypothetical protein
MPRNIVDQFGAEHDVMSIRQRIVKLLDFFATWNTQM